MVVVLFAVAVLIGSSPAILGAVRGHDTAAAIGVLVVGILGGILLVAGAVALLFNGCREASMPPASSLAFAQED